MTMHAGSSSLNPTATRPPVSSPLAAAGPPRPMPKRSLTYTPTFPTSRPLRPFPSIANSLNGMPSRSSGQAAKKPMKIIEPPKNFKGEFVLNLTQAELSRQD